MRRIVRQPAGTPDGGQFATTSHTESDIAARTVDPDATVDHPYIPAGSPHTVVEVRGMVIDLTHRQFDPDAEVPLAPPRESFLKGWRAASYDSPAASTAR